MPTLSPAQVSEITLRVGEISTSNQGVMAEIEKSAWARRLLLSRRGSTVAQGDHGRTCREGPSDAVSAQGVETKPWWRSRTRSVVLLAGAAAGLNAVTGVVSRTRRS